jgi:hypothetical protein
MPDMDDLPKISEEYTRITPKQIGLDVIAILNFDRGVLFTLKGLLLSPYKAIQSYLKGDRRKHAHPIRILVFSSALAAFLTINLVGLNDPNVTVSNSNETAEDGTTTTTDERLAEFDTSKDEVEAELTQDINAFLEKYLNLFFIGSVPLMAIFCWAYYWRKGYNVAEHLVIHCFLASVANTFSIVFMLFSVIWQPLVVIGTILASIYYIFAMMSVYRNNSFWGFIKTMFFLLVYTIIVVTLAFAVLFILLTFWGEEYGIPISS